MSQFPLDDESKNEKGECSENSGSLVPGPARPIHVAIKRKKMSHASAMDEGGNLVSTQEVIRRVLREKGCGDDDFEEKPWLTAVYNVCKEGRLMQIPANCAIMTTLSEIPNGTSNWGKVALDDLLNAPGRQHLKKFDPSRMTEGSIWYKLSLGITSAVKTIMLSDFRESAPNWSSLSHDIKDRWFKAFAQKYNWDRGLNQEVRDRFDEICKARLKDFAYEWKKRWAKGKDKPKWMRKRVWDGLIAFWEDEVHKNRSQVNSQNRRSERGGYGMAKHTCGATPYVRKREQLRNPETGEYPDMVTLMEETHRRKDGTYVDKKAEEIVQKCRELEQVRLTEMSQRENTPADYELTQADKDEIFNSQVEVKKGRRFGYGSIPYDRDMVAPGPSAAKFQELQENLRQTQEELRKMREQCQDVSFWSQMMQNQFPNVVPPSRQAASAPGPSAQPSDLSPSDFSIDL